MGTYTATANFYIDAQRIAKKGEVIELPDREAIELLRSGRLEPDADTAKRWRRAVTY